MTEPPAWAQTLLQRLEILENAVRHSQATTPIIETPQSETPVDPTTIPLPIDETEPLNNLAELLRQIPTNKRKLPDLAAFDGTKNSYRPWKAQAYAKLAIDLRNEPDDVRFWYIYSRLSGKAAAQVTPWISAAIQDQRPITVEDTNGLIKQLDLAYDDPQSMERAMQRLNTLRQGNRPFAKYLALFEKTLLECGGLAWEDAVKKTFLSRGISEELARALVPIQTPASYAAHVSLLHTISHNIESLHARQRDNNRMTTSAPSADPEGGMDWEPTEQSLAKTVHHQRAAWVPREVIEQRRRAKQCFRCGDGRHSIQDCTLLPARHPTSYQHQANPYQTLPKPSTRTTPRTPRGIAPQTTIGQTTPSQTESATPLLDDSILDDNEEEYSGKD